MQVLHTRAREAFGSLNRGPHHPIMIQNSLIGCLKIGFSRWVGTNCKSRPVLRQWQPHNNEHNVHALLRVNSPTRGAFSMLLGQGYWFFNAQVMLVVVQLPRST